MCLGIPGQVVAATEPVGELPFALVSFGAAQRRVCMSCVPEAQPGDFVLVHAGLALTRIDADEAERMLAQLREMELAAEIGPEPDHEIPR